jgi:hypothetical protein
MKMPSKKTSQESFQQVCIDLPGESVQCWRSSDNIKVVLKKHRDVIFNLNLGKGKLFTVHATESDFYNARDKKLILAIRKEKVSFLDGEKMHFWLTRGFKGSLILKEGDKVLLKITPSEWDQNKYDDNPKTKPLPIIVSLGSSQTSLPAKIKPSLPASKSNKQAIYSAPSLPRPVTAQTECPLVCIFDGSAKGIPESILKLLDFKSGGGNSGLVDIDTNEVMTRNWLWGQTAGTAAYAVDNWEWLKACIEKKPGKEFKVVKAKISYIKGKVRFYFSGYTKANNVFRQGGFGPGNSKIINIFAGVGKTESTFLATAKGIGGSFKGFAGISLVFGSATTYLEWKDDVKKDNYDLASSLIMSIVKTILVAAIVVAIVALVVAIVMLGIGAAMPVIAIGALSIGASFVVNYAIEAADKKLGKIVTADSSNSDGLSTVIAPLLRRAGEELSESWTHLMSKFPKDYQWIEF